MIDLRCGDCLELMRGMDAESVHCIVTSPPYWGLRAYGTEPRIWPNGAELCKEHEWAEHIRQGYRTGQGFENIGKWNGKDRPPKEIPHTTAVISNFCSRCGAWRGELGSEPTPELYVAHIVSVFHEARRVLRSDGTLWLNLGDSYVGSVAGVGATKIGAKQLTNVGSDQMRQNRTLPPSHKVAGMKPKDLVGIPWMVAFALRADGWYLRSDIIWSKPNPMPESVTDRPTKAHEYLFLLSKSQTYYYDAEAIRESAEYGRREQPKDTWDRNSKQGKRVSGATRGAHPEFGRNKRSVWTIATKASTAEYDGADYVGDDGRPYIASPDCPVHGHLVRSRMSYTLSGDEQSGLTENRNLDRSDGHVTRLVSSSVSTNGHIQPDAISDNALPRIPDNTSESKSVADRREHTSPAQTADRTSRTPGSDAAQAYRTGLPSPQYSETAKPRSKRKSKTDLAPRPSEHDSVSVQTPSGTPSIEPSPALFDLAEHNRESNISQDGLSVHPLDRIPSHNVDKSSYDKLYCTCSKESIAHFATFPPKLVEPCILAGCPRDGIVLDPFSGTATTGLVAIKHQRGYIGIELKPEYHEIAKRRIAEAQLQLNLF